MSNQTQNPKPKKLLEFILIIGFFFLGIFISTALADWFSPTDDPPTPTDEVLNTGPTAQIKDGSLTLGGLEVYGNIDMGGQQVKGLKYSTAFNEVATKKYADELVAGKLKCYINSGTWRGPICSADCTSGINIVEGEATGIIATGGGCRFENTFNAAWNYGWYGPLHYGGGKWLKDRFLCWNKDTGKRCQAYVICCYRENP